MLIMAYRKWKPKIQGLGKLEYYIRSIKKDILNRTGISVRFQEALWRIQAIHLQSRRGQSQFLNRNVRLLKSMFTSMHSILGLASFCMNYCINAAWHGGNEPVARSSSSWQYPIYSLCGSGQATLLANQAQWHHGHEPAFGIFGSVGRCQVLLENEISISIKLVSRRKHEVLYNVLVDAVLTVGFRKHSGPTPADDMAAQIITDCGNFTLDFKQHGFKF